ncbi:MAG: (2Fe-2S)-binding protein [Planctomycetes bacterium]|nr:(2Fe-2S)-binding protein [Planctomycetota bacterium]
MPRCRFASDGREAVVPAGTGAMSVADALAASVPFSCRYGVCGACLVTVRSGGESLDPPSDGERETLRNVDASPGQRLCCRIVLRADLVLENAPW